MTDLPPHPSPLPQGARERTRVAFTLAEVLITIGIIGIVAAMTIPTLVHNYQKKVWVRQLQTAKLKIEEGFRLAMVDDDVEDIAQTQLWQSLGGRNKYYVDDLPDGFIDILRKYIKISDSSNTSSKVKYLNYNGGDLFVSDITLMNGASIYFFFLDGNPGISSSTARERGAEFNTYYATIYIDVNGKKGPNIWGRDVFNFYLGENGRLYPYAGKDYVIYRGRTIEDYKNSSYYWNSSSATYFFRCSTTKSSYGQGCTARIIEEGWKMNY